MLQSIDHRGPDGSDSWCDDRVALGHQQLRATPEARYDRQPFRDGGQVIVADARVDNRAELLETLSVAKPPAEVPDSELLLAAYRQWGACCPEHVVGSFAFVVWDADEDAVFCARDRFGVKPLYYHVDDDVFAVASEMKALLSLPSVSKRIDEVKVGDFLTGVFEDKKRTYFEDISRLVPAHSQFVTPSGVDTRQYWDLDPTRTIELGSDAAYERRFRELFEQAVRCRLRTPGTVGTALSGGLDSSSITVVTRELLADDTPLHTFSNVYDDAPESDEREYIESVTSRRGITSHYVFLDDVGSLHEREEMMRYYDLPPHDPMHHAIWERAKRADEAGVDVLLEGALGDSAVGYGLGLLPELLRTGRWRHLYDEVNAMADVGGLPRHRLFLSNAVKPLVPRFVSRRYRRLRGERVLAEKRNPTLADSFTDRTDLSNRLKELKATVPVYRETARLRQRRSLLSGMITQSLESSDLANAAFGVTPRYPFTDKRLVEFSLAMPASQQLSSGWTRSIIRRSLHDLLPEKVRRRPWKTNMTQAFWNSLEREDERLQGLVANPGPLKRYIDPDDLRRVYDRFGDGGDNREARALWRALSLSVWIRAYGLDPSEPV